jgi:hypothetical protein
MNKFKYLVGFALVPWALYGQGQVPITCGGSKTCSESATFIAAITDFRAIVQGTNNKSLTLRLGFRNKLNRPLTLAYVQGSGLGTDDRGNRYAPYGAQAVRGIGEIAGNNVDAKFALQPGETSEARFEFSWRARGDEIFALNFELDLTIREVDALPGNQIRLGREHAMHFTGLSANPNPAVSSAQPGIPEPAPAASAPVAPPAPVADLCEAKANCYNSGLFLAEVAGVTPSQWGAYDLLDIRVRFRNLTNQPIILAYKAGSAAVTDNYGGRYAPKDQTLKGIGMVYGGQADPQFVLNPGASGNATFQLYRGRPVNPPVPGSYNFDVSIAQLEVLQSRQIRTVRDYSVSFANVGASAMSATPANVNDSVKKLGDIFRKKK